MRVTPYGLGAGGYAVARGSDGRVVLVAGALPGEVVEVELGRRHRQYDQAVVTEVLEASPDRVSPPCPHWWEGCGGCDWQHVAPGAQARLKVGIVADALRRIGGIPEPPVSVGAELAASGYRTTVRAVVSEGRAGFRRRGSHDPVLAAECMVAHPLLAELLLSGRFGAATEATLRCGARTGQRLVVVEGSPEGVELPRDVRVVSSEELRAGRRAWYREEVSGISFRISARSFFQARPDGAEALVDLVRQGLEGAPDGRLVDAYGGVGLFAATVAGGRPVTLLESSPSAVADARVNVPGARVIRVDVGRWRASPAAAVVADPARTGLGRDGSGSLAGTGAEVVVLVSCDAASLGRDAALLGGSGFRLVWSRVVDLFPGTAHVEAVSRFVR